MTAGLDSSPALRLNNLSKAFGEVKAVAALGATHIPKRGDEQGRPYTCTADDAAYAIFEAGEDRIAAESGTSGGFGLAAHIHLRDAPQRCSGRHARRQCCERVRRRRQCRRCRGSTRPRT